VSFVVIYRKHSDRSICCKRDDASVGPTPSSRRRRTCEQHN